MTWCAWWSKAVKGGEPTTNGDEKHNTSSVDELSPRRRSSHHRQETVRTRTTAAVSKFKVKGQSVSATIFHEMFQEIIKIKNTQNFKINQK